MKWAIIGIVAVVVLGAVGYGIYELTSLPEDAQEWWDEKKLENFPAQAEREIKDMEGRLAKLKETRADLNEQRILLAGGEAMGDSNFSTASTGFMTKHGYEQKIKMYTEAGQTLGNAYIEASKSADAVIDADTGELAPEAPITVSFVNPADGRKLNNEELTAADVLNILGEIEEALASLEYELPLVDEAIADYDAIIKEVDDTIVAQEAALKEFRQEVKKIEAQLKIIKVKEDLAEINKAINGEESNSELGKLIGQYEAKKKEFAARQMSATSKTEDKPKGLADIGKSDPGKPKSSRFLK